MAHATAGYVRDWQTLFDAGTAVGLTDGELLRRYAEGRDGPARPAEAAFGVLIERHGGMVLRVCHAVLADRHAAEDAFQATFLVLARRSRSLRAADSIGPWLHQVALRTARSALSAALRRKRHEQASAPDRPRLIQSGRGELARDDARVLHEEIGRLPARYRRVVVLCYLEGLTHPEAAARLRRPIGTVRSRLSRGRDLLRRRLERRGLAPSILAAVAAPPRMPLGLRDATLALAGKAALQGFAGRLSFGLWACALGALIATAAVLPGRPSGVAAQVAPSPKEARPIQPAPKPEPPGKPVKVHGVVSDVKGKPVAGATVVVALGYWRSQGFEREMVGAPQTVTSGDDGRYATEVRIAPDESHFLAHANIVAYKPGLAPTASVDDCRTEDIAADLTLGEPEPYVGLVRDHKNQPFPGATLTVARMIGPVGRAESRRFLYPSESTVRGTALESLFIVKSDESGRFRFPAVPTPGMLTVYADAPGRAPVHRDAYPVPGTEKAPVVIDPLHPEARLEGRLTTALPGVNVANRKIRIESFSNDIHEVVTTDDQGRFELGGLPRGRVSARLEQPCSRPEDPWTHRPAFDVQLNEGETGRPTLEIVRGGCLEGRVVDAKSGAPVAGFLVSIRPVKVQEIGFTSAVLTDADGRYSARLAPGSWSVYRWDGQPGVKHSIEVVEGKTIVLDAIQMPPKEGP
ncbi:MAG: sigma-70 family RNA polymerase sigma factor [Paludisphaera borealis]|uniref:sigma-70 family RNA polymerase sigma factor n=1 Tax=Paludisphaera borealis TaxID=1387353 RepID=UPI00283DE8FA|nr:sigma-70 family RNA polymerase sigma factor [Paludisphaera borealis]MDR3618656.1 sigma-70 family RNA polymerase sigma factor [Paludisphaera borealis]